MRVEIRTYTSRDYYVDIMFTCTLKTDVSNPEDIGIYIKYILTTRDLEDTSERERERERGFCTPTRSDYTTPRLLRDYYSSYIPIEIDRAIDRSLYSPLTDSLADVVEGIARFPLPHYNVFIIAARVPPIFSVNIFFSNSIKSSIISYVLYRRFEQLHTFEETSAQRRANNSACQVPTLSILFRFSDRESNVVI